MARSITCVESWSIGRKTGQALRVLGASSSSSVPARGTMTAGVNAGFQTLQLLFSPKEADAFMHSYYNLFGK